MDKGDWLGFWGSLIGSITTVIALIFTIKHNQRMIVNEMEKLKIEESFKHKTLEIQTLIERISFNRFEKKTFLDKISKPSSYDMASEIIDLLNSLEDIENTDQHTAYFKFYKKYSEILYKLFDSLTIMMEKYSEAVNKEEKIKEEQLQAQREEQSLSHEERIRKKLSNRSLNYKSSNKENIEKSREEENIQSSKNIFEEWFAETIKYRNEYIKEIRALSEDYINELQTLAQKNIKDLYSVWWI